MTTPDDGLAARLAPLNEWLPISGSDFRNWGPWVYHGELPDKPDHVRCFVGREQEPDTMIYLTENGHGWGCNYSPHWAEITWYRMRCNHPYYRTHIPGQLITLADHERLVKEAVEAAFALGRDSAATAAHIAKALSMSQLDAIGTLTFAAAIRSRGMTP